MSDLDAPAREVDVDGTTVHLHVDGPADGRPVVLLHGGGPDAAGVSWKHAAPALSDDYRVYAPDWPGYGDSDPVPDDVTPDVDYYVEVLDGLLGDLGLVDVALVGVSLGGGVALGYALEHPARVSGLVPVSSYGLGSEVPGGRLGSLAVKVPKLLEATGWLTRRSRRVTRAALARVVAPGNLDESFVDDVMREASRSNAGEAYRRFQRAEVGWRRLRTDYSDRMGDLPARALFVHGEADPLVPVAWSKRAADAAPVADLFTLVDCGHWPPRECPEAFVSRLRAWLAR